LVAGWPVNEIIDKAQKYNAVTLACHLDNLEMVHLLDLYGADINQGAGKYEFTPLMSATARWNVRIVDYLIERGVNPFVKDSFGFTASKKAQIKNLRTIGGMLNQYEN
jgi:ankyrin repeat protein